VHWVGFGRIAQSVPELTFGFYSHECELRYIESDTYDPAIDFFVKPKSPRGPEKVYQDIELGIGLLSMFCGRSSTYNADIKIVR
jgi:hypothetical protein